MGIGGYGGTTIVHAVAAGLVPYASCYTALHYDGSDDCVVLFAESYEPIHFRI